jgi:predicted DNA-binding protein YlxM (UPF0122 family)
LTQTNKLVIEKYIKDNKENIIREYSEGMSVSEIAELYNVALSTIYVKLGNWGIVVKQYRGAFRRRNEKTKKTRYKREFSQAFIANRKANTVVNDGKIDYIEFINSTEDQRLVRNLLSRPIIG